MKPSNLTSKPIFHSVQQTWNSSLPTKIKTVKGNSRIYIGIVLQCAIVASFSYLLYLGLVTPSTTTYMSLDYTKYEKTLSPRKIRNCSDIPLTISTDVAIDEAGNWSTSSSYDEKNTMKEISFMSYSGDITDFNQEMEDLNNCIKQVNTFCSAHLFPENLVYMAFKVCTSITETSKLTFSINWSYIFDFRVSKVSSYVYNDSLSDYEESQNASMTGMLHQSGKELTLTVICEAGFKTFPRDSCGLAYSILEQMISGSYDLKDLPTYDLEDLPTMSSEMQLNLDSLVRCVAVNSGMYNASYNDDLLVMETSSYGYSNLYKAVYVHTDGPNTMYLDTKNNTCYIYYEDSEKEMFLQPSMQFSDPACSLPCGISDRKECSSERRLSIWLGLYSTFDLSHFGAIALESLSAQGYINDYFFYIKNDTELSCRPLVHLLPLGNETDLPFTLIESFFKCTDRDYTSWSTVLASAYSNSQLVSEFLILISVAFVLKLNKKSLAMRYRESEIELANLELAIERIQSKQEMGLSTYEFHPAQHSADWKIDSPKLQPLASRFISLRKSEVRSALKNNQL